MRAAVAAFDRMPARRRAELTVIWADIVSTIHDHMEKRRSPPKVFEVHHSVDVARLRFFHGVLSGWPDAMCRTAALTVLPGRNPMRLKAPTEC